MERLGSLPTQPGPSAGIDPRSPERLVDVDVAQAGDDALREQGGFDRPRCGVDACPQQRWAEHWVKRFGPQCGQGWQPRVVAVGDDRQAAEASNIAEHERAPIVEGPPGAHVVTLRRRIRRPRRTRRAQRQHPGHSQMNDQLGVGRRTKLGVGRPPLGTVGVGRGTQIGQQVLAPPTHRDEPPPDRCGGLGELRRRMPPRLDHRRPGELWIEGGTDRFDLGKLGHGDTGYCGARPMPGRPQQTGVLPPSQVTLQAVLAPHHRTRDHGWLALSS